MKSVAGIVILLLTAPFFLKAQNTQNKIWRPFDKTSFILKANSIPSMPLKTNNPESICKITNDAPHLAFFCSMENKFRNRFNVYFKLRAGNDEMYRNLTEQNKQK